MPARNGLRYAARVEPRMRIRISGDVLLSEIRDEAVLLDLRNGTYFVLNEVGLRAWRSLSETGLVDDAIRAVAAAFDAPEAQIRQDVLAFVQQLIERGLAE